jgi:hypothetical protein
MHRVLLRHILDKFDSISSGTDQFSTLLAIDFVYKEIPSLRLCESVNQVAVEHLKKYLDHRRLILFGALSTTQIVIKKTKVSKLKTEFKLSGKFLETSDYYPPGHCKSRRVDHSNDGEKAGCPECLQPPTLNVQRQNPHLSSQQSFAVCHRMSWRSLTSI